MTGFRLVKEEGFSTADKDYTPIVSIYADASCLGNGSADASAGCGAVVIDRNRKEVKLLAKYLGPITNQQAEILACASAIDELRRPCRVEIFSDSKYVVDTMTGLNRMRMNRLFWNQLVESSLGHHITWRWIKGHNGGPLQEAADRLARAASTAMIDIPADDLKQLAEHLSREENGLNIRSFEIELDKIVSRFRFVREVQGRVYRPEYPAAFPSAFSA